MQLELSDLEKIFNRIQEAERKIETLEARIAELEKVKSSVEDEKKPFPVEKISTRYRSLARFLFDCEERRINLPYAKIEEILGFKLPATAYNFPHSYWANTETHSYSSSWLAVDYKARVDAEKKTVTFEKIVI